MNRKNKCNFQLPIFDRNISTTMSQEHPRCNTCNCIYSLSLLNNSFQICDECIIDNKVQSTELEQLQYDHKELQSQLDDTISELEDTQYELGQTIVNYDRLEDEYRTLNNTFIHSQTTLRLVSEEYHRMYKLIKKLQSASIYYDDSSKTDLNELCDFDLWEIDDLVCKD